MMRKLLGVGAVALLVLAACGKSSNGPSSGGGGGGSGTLTVSTRSASGVGTVLVNAQGLTLYHLQGETTSNIKCSGSCLATWPPLLDTSGAKVTAGSGVSGTLTTFSSPSGTQVAYNGMPLYTFSSDTPGQVTGQGVDNFFAVTPSMHASSGGGGGGGYHYGGGSSPSSGGGY